MEIFGLKTINFEDLCSLAGTCKRFQKLVHRIVSKELKFLITGSAYHDIYNINVEYSALAVSDILAAVGSVATTVTVMGQRDDNESNMVFDSIVRYCRDNLKSLTLCGVNFSENVSLGKLKPNFERLQVLHLASLRISPVVTLFDELYSLVDLRVIDVENSHIILNATFPKLKRFYFGEGNLNLNMSRSSKFQHLEMLTNFISRHRALKALQLVVDQFFANNVSVIIKTIGMSCMELEQLSLCSCFPFIKPCFQPLQRIKSLKALSVWHFCIFEELDLETAVHQLAELRLYAFRLFGFGRISGAVVQLKKLCLRLREIDPVDIYGIVSRLTIVEELQSDLYDEDDDEETYLKLDEIMEREPKALTISCTANSKVREETETRFSPMDLFDYI